MPEVGKSAPSLKLENQDGVLVDLSKLAGKWVVVYFYPKDSTPGCTTEACDFRDNFARLGSKGAVVLGVSKDSAKSHAKFREKQGLPFDLLVDADGAVCEAWGVWRMKKFMGREGMGIVRSTFLVDPTGRIARIWSPVSVKGHVQEVLDAIA
ncbi:MAG TPA: thioredoxin-dependent thiol peroxidase [Fibrobacteria bacterium]|nr:thioredoxin-dependent thiol peroxidase [Fibrobacteria bacterium]